MRLEVDKKEKHLRLRVHADSDACEGKFYDGNTFVYGVVDNNDDGDGKCTFVA